jgi:hypothetical protein
MHHLIDCATVNGLEDMVVACFLLLEDTHTLPKWCKWCPLDGVFVARVFYFFIYILYLLRD